MPDFETLRFFAKLAETLNYARAAAALGIPTSRLSRRIQELEAALGVRLFHRTTRRVVLTEEGAAFHQEMQPGIRTLEQAIEVVRSSRGTPQGTVRLSTPVEFGTYLVDTVMPGFFEKYPAVRVEWDFANDHRNLVQNRLDLAIRTTRPSEESLVVRKLGSTRFRAFVSPKCKLPRVTGTDPEQLAGLPWLVFQPSNVPNRDTIRFCKKGKDYEFRPHHAPPFRANNLTAVKSMVKQGLGIGFLPRFIFEKEISEGEIEEFLPRLEWKPEVDFVLVYPSREFIPPKTRVMIDWILERTKLDGETS